MTLRTNRTCTLKQIRASEDAALLAGACRDRGIRQIDGCVSPLIGGIRTLPQLPPTPSPGQAPHSSDRPALRLHLPAERLVHRGKLYHRMIIVPLDIKVRGLVARPGRTAGSVVPLV